MDIRCPSCSKLFRVADEKISGKGIRFKCSKCAEVITITKDDFEMDLLAREDEVTGPVPRQPSGPATRPSRPRLNRRSNLFPRSQSRLRLPRRGNITPHRSRIFPRRC